MIKFLSTIFICFTFSTVSFAAIGVVCTDNYASLNYELNQDVVEVYVDQYPRLDDKMKINKRVILVENFTASAPSFFKVSNSNVMVCVTISGSEVQK